MAKLTLLLICITTLLFSCKREKWVEPRPFPNPEYLIFGQYYGLCGGETCREIFKLERDKLSEDTLDDLPYANFYYGQYKQLSQQKFDDTKDILQSFPMGLLNEQTRVLGRPDESDGGGYYVEYNFNGIRKMWLIDKARGNVPAEYHNFLVKMEEKIRLLR